MDFQLPTGQVRTRATIRSFVRKEFVHGIRRLVEGAGRRRLAPRLAGEAR